MSYSRYLQAVAKGLHDYVLPQLEAGLARDVLGNALRAIAAIAVNLERQAPELLQDLDIGDLPSELAAFANCSASEGSERIFTVDNPVDDVAAGPGSIALITAGARWFGASPWPESPALLLTAKSLLQWERNLRGRAIGRIAEIEQGRIDNAQSRVDPPDISQDALQRYLQQRLDAPALRVSDFHFLTGGRVRQTALFSISGHPDLPNKLVVQRDNPAGLTSFKGPVMQYQLLGHLHAAGMRVPSPVLVETRQDVLGGAFLICGQLPGKSPVPSMDYFSPPPKSESLATSLAKQLAILHQAPIGSLRNALATTLDPLQEQTWATDTKIMEAAWNANAHVPSMAMSAAFAWQRAHVDEIGNRLGVVHGDLLLHNVLADQDEISGILDWEVAHIGHPAEDLGYLRPVIEQMMDWNRFLDVYAQAGGVYPTANEIDFFTLRALTTLSVWVQQARAAFENGLTADCHMAEVGSAFLPRLIDRLSHQIASILERS